MSPPSLTLPPIIHPHAKSRFYDFHVGRGAALQRARLHKHTHAHTHIHTHSHTHSRKHTHTHTNTHTYTLTHSHTHTHTHTHTLTHNKPDSINFHVGRGAASLSLSLCLSLCLSLSLSLSHTHLHTTNQILLIFMWDGVRRRGAIDDRVMWEDVLAGRITLATHVCVVVVGEVFLKVTIPALFMGLSVYLTAGFIFFPPYFLGSFCIFPLFFGVYNGLRIDETSFLLLYPPKETHIFAEEPCTL